ncbi:hypothetical protein ACVWZV_009837 [Bradyrhizobium sp. GM5.1]
MVSQRERFPKAVQSNARVGLCVDLEDAGGAEHILPWAVGRVCHDYPGK